MADIKRVVIHSLLLNSFKRKCLEAYPYEYITAVLGKQKGTTLYIHALDKLDITEQVNAKRKLFIQYDQPEEEMEAGTNLKYFGTIHSHPGYGGCIPSDDDKKDLSITATESDYSDGSVAGETLTDKLMGIMYLEKRTKVNHFGLVFYDVNYNQLEVLISDNVRKNQKKKPK